MNKHQRKAIDRALIIRQMERSGEPLTIVNIAKRLGVEKHAIGAIWASFERHGLEVPDYIRLSPGRSSKWRDGQVGQMPRERVSTGWPAGLEVMDETIRPWGDGQWIGMVR